MPEALIIDACRTPRGIGKVGKGSLAHLHPQRLGATVLAAIQERNDLDTADVDDIIWGTSTQRGKQGNDLGRMAALEAGYDVRSSGVTLDRFCGSGITTVNMAAAQIMSGMEQVVVAGGTEMMSHAASIAVPGEPQVLDSGNLTLRAKHPQSHQGVCADAIATLEGIDRETADALALVSQQRAAKAMEEGRFDGSLIPVKNDDGSVALSRDEFPRPSTTMEALSGLRPFFEAFVDVPIGEAGETYGSQITDVYPQLKDGMNHIHHAGNSSGVVDGAAALLLASEDYASSSGLTPRARIVATANMGDCPTLMLNAPVPSAQKALRIAGLTVDDIDVFEINEAFAVVAEKFIRDLNLDREKVNINGGAIALGHPIGATGSILIGTALDELERSGGRYALITMCAAGGMAPAVIIERL
ncbi:MAG: acetyl-CoA C-acetyltransferase [Pseudomonadota bacterium]